MKKRIMLWLGRPMDMRIVLWLGLVIGSVTLGNLMGVPDLVSVVFGTTVSLIFFPWNPKQ